MEYDNKFISDKKINISSFNEILQDNFIIVFIGEIIKRMENVEAQKALEEFISEFSPIFIYEAYFYLKEFELIEEDKFYISKDLKDKVKKYRMSATKRNVSNSSNIRSAKEKMGIDFNDDVFDINVIVNNNKLQRLNFSNHIKSNDIDFFGMCYATNCEFSRTVFKVITKLDEEEYRKILILLLEKYKIEIKELELKIQGTRYSYKSSKLFKNKDISETDKLFILYRYNMLNTLIILKEFFRKINFSIKMDSFIDFDANNFLRKIISLEIDLLRKDFETIDTKFSQKVKDTINNMIIKNNEDFYKDNTSIRNNIHYSYTNKIKKNIKNFDRLEKQYLDIVFKLIQNEIYICIENEEINMTNFFYECSKMNISNDEIEKNYENYYTQFMLLGKIKKW